MITQVRLRNFRSIGDVTVDLGPITLLVGKNGAGKSTFLSALQLLRELVTVGLRQALDFHSGFQAIRRWQPGSDEVNVTLGVTVQSEGLDFDYDIVIAEQDDKAVIRQEVCRIHSADGAVIDQFTRRDGVLVVAPRLLVETLGGQAETIDPSVVLLQLLGVTAPKGTPYAQLRELIAGLTAYSIYPHLVGVPQRPTVDRRLMEHGENTASILHKVRLQSGTEPYIAALGRVVEDFGGISTTEAGGYLVTTLWRTNDSEVMPAIPASQESDGTLRVLGILAALHQDPIPPFVAIEEPELHIHPGALGAISDVLRQAALRTQIVVTTQSPDLISRFRAEEIRVVERVGGATQIGPIAEHQREALNQQLFSAGDLLRIEGLVREPVKVGGDA